MPVYEYECPKCGVFEFTQSITSEPLTKCPTCKRKVKRLISLNNFILKGTGWYVTDYARKGNGGSNGKSYRPKEEKGESKTHASESAKESKKESSNAKKD